jgi:hypothetical protein
MNLEALLKHAMELEKTQVMLYKGLEKKFSFSREISQFWSDMAEDEKRHYEGIVKLHSRLEPDQLSIEVDDDLYGKVCKGLRELSAARLDDVFDLDDACKLANEVEDYETQAVFAFAADRFKYDPHRLDVANSMLVHLDKLASFSDRFRSLDEKRRIKAIL